MKRVEEKSPGGVNILVSNAGIMQGKREVTVDGFTALKASVPEIAGSGPGVVGLYSNDNDGGVWFDNFCVWIDGA